MAEELSHAYCKRPTTFRRKSCFLLDVTEAMAYYFFTKQIAIKITLMKMKNLPHFITKKDAMFFIVRLYY